MKSSEPWDLLDLERGVPTTEADIKALRRRPAPAATPEEYLRFLESFGHASPEALRRRKGPRGEPFVLEE
jgi:hypothetical protein